MKFDKETIISLSVCLLLLLAWPSICNYMGWFSTEEETAEVSEVKKEQPAAIPAEKSVEQAENKAEKAAPAETVKIPAKEIANTIVQDHDLHLSNEYIDLTVSAEKGCISNIRFLKYLHDDRRNNIASDARLFELILPGTVKNVQLKKDNDDAVTAVITAFDGKLQIEQKFTIKDQYIVNCEYTLRNISNAALDLDSMVICGGSAAPWHTIAGDIQRTMSHRLDLLTAENDHEDIDADEDDEDYYFSKPPKVKWAAVSNKYFCSILKEAENNIFTIWQEDPRPTVTDRNDKKYNIITAGAKVPEMVLKPGESKTLNYSSYNGPKNSDTVAAFVPDGEEVMHLAWGPLNILARFLMWILNLLYALFNSYGISIIILTLLVRTLFYPLTAKSNESMRKMQKVQPMFKELREKYKDNPQLLNQKMSELYRAEGINPFAGCLPILLQIPIFFALYAMLDNAIALRHVSFLWAKNLAAPDTIFSIPLGFTLPLANISAIPVNPLVLMMTALMVIQQRMTPNASMDPAQKRMMMMMPIIMLIFLYSLPSGLTLYWTISNLFSIIQLWLQQKRNRALEAAANGQSK
ncbi:MAG: membrane protein insertase YidC [Lentisphaerae bacterium]|nr:membrane protein insertase YidC [Lentisphaerota bacterium]